MNHKEMSLKMRDSMINILGTSFVAVQNSTGKNYLVNVSQIQAIDWGGTGYGASEFPRIVFGNHEMDYVDGATFVKQDEPA